MESKSGSDELPECLDVRIHIATARGIGSTVAPRAWYFEDVYGPLLTPRWNMKSSEDLSPPFLNSAQMRVVDRLMVDDFEIGLIQMMESAGRNLAHLTRERLLAGDPLGKRIAVLAGPGGNGGGVLVAARRLHGWGAQVSVYLSRPVAALAPLTQHQARTLQRLAILSATEPVRSPAPRAAFDAVLDGLIGYGLKGPPRGRTAQLIDWANRQPAAIIALDIPSGIDASSGFVHDPAIRALATIALALPKRGLTFPQARECAGELYVADIGVPPELYSRAQLGIKVGPLFARGDIVRLS